MYMSPYGKLTQFRMPSNPGAPWRASKVPVRKRRGICDGRWLLYLVSAFFLLLPHAAQAQVQQVRRVLILNDLGIISSPGFAEVDQAVFAGLQNSPYRIELYHESLELTLFPDQASQRQFYEEFVRKYSIRKPDVIIAAGSGSFKFIAESHEDFLRDIPIIFCGIVGKIPQRPNPDLHFTGVLGKLHPEETLKVALQLLPGTKHVVVVGGMGEFDKGFEAIARQGFQNYESKLEFTYLTQLTMPALLERLKHLPINTIVYHTAITQDAAGERFIDSAQSVPLVTSAANAPVFVMDDVDLRGGAVGGDLVNWADDSSVAAKMAMRVLNGEKPDDIPIVTSNDDYTFDWRALRRWRLKESNLPPGSIILNRPPSFWQVYRRYILAGVFVILAQALAIFALLWQRARRKKTEVELRESEGRFRLVANTAPVMIWMSGPDTLRNYFNQPWLEFTGRSLEEELGNGWADGVYKDDVQRCLDTYIGAFDRRESFQMEYRVRRHDGKYRWLFDLGVPRFNADDSFAGYIGSCLDVTERRLAEEALSTMGRRLIEAHEEERTWIARELHDDINQQLAVLVLDLDLTLECPVSPEARHRIQDVKERVANLGKDIQALSHRLHSSKLEYLGLASAAAGFCQEFSEQHKIEIDFHKDGIPTNLPQETSLCLFRVLQEALQNAVKHSGSEHFQVTLFYAANEIHLRVSDSGVGFDAKDAMTGRGIGITSMRERLKLIDGQLSINSTPQEGTTIHARAPLGPNVHSAVANA